jgi:hypothetical protein
MRDEILGKLYVEAELQWQWEKALVKRGKEATNADRTRARRAAVLLVDLSV